MAQPMRVELEAERAPETYGVLVGWRHSPCGDGINLKVQSAVSRIALSEGRIDAHHLLMTRNQALLLARYLLEATEQTLDIPARRHGWRAAWSKLRRR